MVLNIPSAYARFVVLLAFVSSPANAGQKRDIQSIALGMPWEEIRAKLKCDITGCDTPDGHLTFGATGPDSRVFRIQFLFRSGLLPRAMIDQVSTQYALKADPISQRDIDTAMSERREYNADYGRVITTTGGQVAHWNGPSGLDIRLAVNKPSNGATEYILTLTDNAMINAARTAKEREKKDREAVERKTNIKPKF